VHVEQFLEPGPAKTATSYPAYKRHLIQLANNLRTGKSPYQAYILDSFTMLAEASLAMILANTGKLGSPPEIQHWGMAFNEQMQIIGLLRTLPIPVIMIAHDQLKSADSNEIEIAVSGKNMPGKISRCFDEIWYSRVKKLGQGKHTQTLQSITDGRAMARGVLPDGTDAGCGMWGLLEKIGYKKP
jgi:hypothetical protein